MNVDIWSDVRCPFCYIGKRQFETALNTFPHKESVEVQWHSFQLDPTLTTNPEVNAVEHLAETKGISKAQAEEMFSHVTQVAKKIGLDFNIGKSVVANSFNAHKLIQLAKTKSLANEIEEQLFKAHFTEGKNIDDKETLVQIGVAIGLDEQSIREVLITDAFEKEVKEDESQAQSMGIRGVPFFVINNNYAVSGAQSPDIFLQALGRGWKEFEKEKQPFIITEGESCSTDGTCN